MATLAKKAGKTLALTAQDKRDLLETALTRIGGTLKKVLILPQTFSVESGELTPTMKLKRKVVNQKFATEIDSLYGDDH